MIVVYEHMAQGAGKPVICSNCRRGRLGDIPKGSRVRVSRQGKPPQEERRECFRVKCPVCGARWALTIE